MAQKNPIRGRNQEQEAFDLLVLSIKTLLFNTHDFYASDKTSLVAIMILANQHLYHLRKGELDQNMPNSMAVIKKNILTRVEDLKNAIYYIGADTQERVQRALTHVRQNDPDRFEYQTGSGQKILEWLLERANFQIQQATRVLNELEFYIQDTKHIQFGQVTPDFFRIRNAFHWLMYHFSTNEDFADYEKTLVALTQRAKELNARIGRNERIRFDIIEGMHELDRLLPDKLKYMEECLEYANLHKYSLTAYQAFNDLRRNEPDLFQNETGFTHEIMDRLFEKARETIETGKAEHRKLKRYKNDIKPGPIYHKPKGIPSDPWLNLLQTCDNLLKKAKEITESFAYGEKWAKSRQQFNPNTRNHIPFLKWNQNLFEIFKYMNVWEKTIDDLIVYFEGEMPEWERKRQALQESEPSVETNHQLKGVEMVLAYPQKMRFLKFSWQALIKKCFDLFIFTMKTAIIRIVKRNYQHISPDYAEDPDSVELLLKEFQRWTVSTYDPLWRRCDPLENLQHYMRLDHFYQKLTLVSKKIRSDWEHLSLIQTWGSPREYPRLKKYAEDCLNEVKFTDLAEYGFIESFNFFENKLFWSFIDLDNAKRPLEQERSRYRSSHPDEFDEQGNPIDQQQNPIIVYQGFCGPRRRRR